MLSFWVLLLLNLNFTRLSPSFRLFVRVWSRLSPSFRLFVCVRSRPLPFLSPFRLCAERAWEQGYLHHMAALHECQLSNDLEIMYTVLFMLPDNIIPLTVSWLSWQCQWLPWQWLPWQWMACAYLCLLNDRCFNQITCPQATCLSCCEGVCWNTWTWSKICLSCLLPI